MMYPRFLALCLLDIVANLVGYIVNPFLPMFADKRGNLPYRLRWFQTHDDTLDGTEARHIMGTMALRTPTGEPKNKLCRYILRVMWLYRNNAYSFSYFITGVAGPFITLSESGIMPRDRYPAQEGRHFRTFMGVDGHTRFQFKLVKSRGNGKCHEVNIGWKYGQGDRAQLVMRWTPFRTYEASPPTKD